MFSAAQTSKGWQLDGQYWMQIKSKHCLVGCGYLWIGMRTLCLHVLNIYSDLLITYKQTPKLVKQMQ